VQLEVGGWLREDLLADMARSIPMIHGGVVAELCGSGGDWSLATLDRDEPSVGSGAGGGGIRVYHIGHLPAEANRPTGFLPPAKEGGHPPDAWARAPAAGDIAVVADGAAAPLTTTPASGPQRPEREICDPSICAFTFDSGPHPTLTHRVLDALDETGMKGSFFLVGSQAKRCPEVVRRIVASGHEVAVQGYDYEDLSRCTYSTVAISIEKTIALICDVAGVMPRWFRPPFARCSALVREVCRLKALKPVGWHISSGDWTRQHHHRTVSTVLAHGMEGAVVLFHDGCGDPWQTAQAVSALGCIARANGTAGVTLTDLESLVSLPPLDPSESITTSAGYYA
jgi:peptidoglycan/xylan/chitin deacetylase (PgdA/CDA1 family)